MTTEDPAAYNPRRNIVPRPDGIRVNVARFRGQLFVCASGCCCGRTEDGFAPVPADRYHEEWERRRLRNFVHLTVGGCLGPCALANVVLLLFDGEATWLHSISTDTQIMALYDHLEAHLESPPGVAMPLPAPLAEFEFTASTWQERPDGQPLDDHREWRVHRDMPAADASEFADGDTCALPPAYASDIDAHACDIPADDSPSHQDAADDSDAGAGEEQSVDLAVVRMQGPAAMPRKNGELVFDAPWQGRAFGMTTALHEDGRYDWDDFRDKLIARIALAEEAAEAAGAEFDYYACWVRAFEELLAEKGIVATGELDERAAEFEFGEREEVY